MNDDPDARCNYLFPPPVIYSIWALGYLSIFVFFPILYSYAQSPIFPSHCLFNFTTRALGSKRDVLFLYTTHWHPGVELAVRSFRSVCFLCRIVVFVSPTFVMNDRQTVLFKNLDVEIISNCGNLNGRPLIPHMFRYECIREYMDDHTDIQRVFHCDAHDVFFQGNPFSAGLPSNQISFVVEPHCIRTCGWNLAWITQCYGMRGNALSNRFIVCSGSIGGSAREFRKLIDLMISQPEWKRCWDVSLDQPILNYLLWSGEIDKHGIRYVIGGCDSGFYTIQWCTLERQIKMNQDNVVVSRTGNPPFFLHQYNRVDKFDQYLFGKCFVRQNES
jgi:hypothetical protein